MRIIAGKLRGKILKSPKDEKVRPTLDRVKEALFSMINSKVRGAVVLDLFSGSGALGLEALSRGATYCTFVDFNKESVKLTNVNIKACGMEDKVRILEMEANRAIEKSINNNWVYDLIFIDPPYEGEIAKKVLQEYDFNIIMSKEGIVIVETDLKEDTLSEIGNLIKFKEKTYGQTRISLYERKQNEESSIPREF